jgi:hypothetical protein
MSAGGAAIGSIGVVVAMSAGAVSIGAASIGIVSVVVSAAGASVFCWLQATRANEAATTSPAIFTF